MLRSQPNDKLPGFDHAFQCDYMGSAEFEFGSLAHSLKRVTSSLEMYDVIKTEATISYKEPEKNGKDPKEKNAGVFLFGPKIKSAEVLEAFNKLHKAFDYRNTKRILLKEPAWLGYRLDLWGKPMGYEPVVLLWDIDNHWFACLGKDTVRLLQKSLEQLKARWTADGKI